MIKIPWNVSFDEENLYDDDVSTRRHNDPNHNPTAKFLFWRKKRYFFFFFFYFSTRSLNGTIRYPKFCPSVLLSFCPSVLLSFSVLLSVRCAHLF